MSKLLAGAALPFLATIAFAGQPLSDKQMSTITEQTPQAAGSASSTKHPRHLANHRPAKRKLYSPADDHRPHR
jgi:hypothetical protein